MAKLFFSYSHKDEVLRDTLQTHLEMLRRSGAIETWHDRMIRAGEEFDGAIDRNMEDADVILLLVSSDFLASSYCFDVEVKRAMERHETGTARVIPVNGIIYSHDDRSRGNSMNEMLSIEVGEQSLSLKPMGRRSMTHGIGQESGLSREGAAEFFWSMLMEPLQRK